MEGVIYALTDPDGGEIYRYIGKTTRSLGDRMFGHIQDALHGMRNRHSPESVAKMREAAKAAWSIRRAKKMEGC